MSKTSTAKELAELGFTYSPNENGRWDYTVIQAACAEAAAQHLAEIAGSLRRIETQISSLGADGIHQVIREQRATINRKKKLARAKKKALKAAA